MMTIYCATGNRHKASELSALLNFTLKLPMDEGLQFEVEENGLSYAENAMIKARALWQQVKQPVLADDSGLEVLALPGQLGIRTARYGGVKLSQQERNSLLLQNMQKVTDRRARFVCCLVLFCDEHDYCIVEQNWAGEIAREPSGTHGFGYDPLFMLPSLGKTAALLTDEEKNCLSHRGKAASLMASIIKEKAFPS